MGVATVGVLYATVKRWFGPAAGLLAGAALALTPVSVLMFRFNNPDALLVLLLVGAAYAMVRALEAASTRWLLLAGFLVGCGFLTKMLQAFLVLPVFALVYLVAAPTPVRRRLGQLLGALAATIVSAGWWVAVVELVPASSRPYIGGSQTNSVLDLVLGYNGLGRLTGDETGSVTGGGAGQGGSMWGATGWARMFDGEIGGQIAWLIPAALLLLAGGLWLTWGRPAHRPSPRRLPALGRLAARDRAGVQLHAGDLPRVLHRGPRACGRRARGHGRGRAVGAARRSSCRGCCSRRRSRSRPGGRGGCWRAAPTGTPGSGPTVLVVGLVDRGGPAARRPYVLTARGRRCGRGGGRRPGRAGGVRAEHRGDPADRIDRDGRSGGLRRAGRSWWSSRRACGWRPTARRPAWVASRVQAASAVRVASQGRRRAGRAARWPGWHRRPGWRGRHGRAAPGQHGERRARGAAAGRRVVVPLGRSHGRRQQRGRLPAGLGGGGHADRRLQRQRPVARPSSSSRPTSLPATSTTSSAVGGSGRTAAATPRARSRAGWRRASPRRPSTG